MVGRNSTFAEQIGASHYYISRWERGTASPSPYYRQKLCAIFGKNAEELGLLPGEDTPDQEGIQPPQGEPSGIVPPSEMKVYDPAIPRLLADQTMLVGRGEMLDMLRGRLCRGRSLSSIVLSGIPGVGKTTLAVALADDSVVLDYFRNGVLWAGLGPRPNLEGLLSRWGTLLGVASSEGRKHTTSDDWARSIRAIISERRILLVIDDAWEIEDALALKVGGPNTAYILTTRFPQIAVQFAPDGATTLEELTSEDSVSLLARLAPEVIAQEPQSAQALASSVGGLPLALTLIGKYLRAQSYGGQPRRIRAAIERLRDTESRLRLSEPQALLERSPGLSKDASISLQAVILISDQHLDEQARTALRALSVFLAKPNSFSEEAALAVSAAPVETLDVLSDAGLLESRGPGRYTLHQTIADYARAHLAAAAYTRLAAYIADYVEEHERDYEALEQEASNVFAGLEAASSYELYPEFIRGTNAFAHFLFTRGMYPQAEAYLMRAAHAARSLRDEAGLATALLNLGDVLQSQGHYDKAEALLQEGLILIRQAGDSRLLGDFLRLLGVAARMRGEYEQSETYLQEGMTLARQSGDIERLGSLLSSLGSVTSERGQFVQAESYYQEGLALARQVGDREQITKLLVNLASIAAQRGNTSELEAYSQQALQVARQIGYREAVSIILGNLGAIATEQRRYIQAREYLQEALEIARQVGQCESVVIHLANLGGLATEQDNYVEARVYLQEALAIARQLGRPWLLGGVLYHWAELNLKQQDLATAAQAFREVLEIASGGSQENAALALYGLARVAAARGDYVEVSQKGQESLATFEAIGGRQSAEVRKWLDALSPRLLDH